MFFESLSDNTQKRLIRRLEEVNHDIRTRGISRSDNSHSAIAGIQDLLTGYSYGEFYDWDLYYENLYLSHFGIARYCRTNFEAFLDRQLECGFVARTMMEQRMRQHFKPFLAQIAVLGSRQFGRFEWLKDRYYQRLIKYLDYWCWFCDFDKNGLSVWDSADHSGMDNQDLRAGHIYSMTIEGVDLNSYLVREFDAMSVIAEGLGLEEDASQWKEKAAAMRGRINDIMWDEKDGFYYDRNERTGELVRYKSASSFMALWAGVATQKQADRMIKEHLLNPEEFWLEYPLASWAKNEKGYYQQRRGVECTWMGACWIPVNYSVMHALVRYGYQEAAAELAGKSFEMVLSEDATREYYNAETGVGQGLNPFWGWSALAYAMPFELEAGYDPTDPHAEIIPLLSDITGVEYRFDR